jgi:spoIIIJ-associated protein
VAHAEASARTVEAAVTAAAAQLGLRSDQVDVEVLEEPVPSTFGYIGSPARVRVTSREPASARSGPASGDARDAAEGSPAGEPGVAVTVRPSDTPGLAAAGQPSEAPVAAASGEPPDAPGTAVTGQRPDASEAVRTGKPSDADGVAAHGQPSGAVEGSAEGRPSAGSRVTDPADPSDLAQAVPSQADSEQAPGSTQPASAGQVSGPAQPGIGQVFEPAQPGAGQADLAQAVAPQAPAPEQASGPGRAANPTEVSGGPAAAGTPGAGSASQETNALSRTQGSFTTDASEAAIDPSLASGEAPRRPAPDPARDLAAGDSSSAQARDTSEPTTTQSPSPTALSSSISLDDAGHLGGAVSPGDPDPTRSEAGRESLDQSPTDAQSSSSSADGGDRGSILEGSAAVSTAAAASAMERAPQESAASDRSHADRPRRTHRDEPIDPEMIEADTERAGDFLEGLLDALDVDGDITTWIDEAGGHIELEGSDLNVLVGSNGETLDALQELTRIAVLRQSKRRVRLLLDINGFRSRQRDELISVVKATAERVIKSREHHEFEPMTPAERKIVHDAVAAIDGVQTESLGEEPYRRVVIRPT